MEEGRNAVIDAHQGLLDLADGAIARVRSLSLANANKSSSVMYLGATVTASFCQDLIKAMQLLETSA